jgi:hypothetical protein
VQERTGDGGNSVISFASNGDEHSVWRLEPVANRTACYSIRNVKYDELLYRSTRLTGVVPLPARSYVYTWPEWVYGGRVSVVSANDEAFMCTFRQAFEPTTTLPNKQTSSSQPSGERDKMEKEPTRGRVVLSRGRKATIFFF